MSHTVRRIFVSRLGEDQEVIVEGRSYREADAGAAKECERLRAREDKAIDSAFTRLAAHFKASKKLDPAPPQATDASE